MIHINHLQLEDLAKTHYNEICGITSSSSDNKILKKIECEYKKGNLPKDLFEKIETNLKDLLSGKPQLLDDITQDIITLGYDKSKFIEKISGKDKPTELGKTLNSIFDYKTWSKKNTKGKNRYNAYSLLEKLKVDACPYCNREYTITVKKPSKHGSSKEIVRPALDHFYPKSLYPYLTLSFYNLIPSCTVCNSSMKGDIDFFAKPYIHPYCEGFEQDAVFTYIPSSYEDLVGLYSNGKSSKDMIVKLLINESNSDKATRIKNSTDVFKLDELYTEHANYVREIIRKRVISNNAYLKDLAKIYDGLFSGEDELYNLALGNFYKEEDFFKRPLAKLTKDIANELGLKPRF